MSIVLEDEGYDCTTVKDGAEAIKAIDEASYDIVISDLKMPKADGLEVLEMCYSILHKR